ncbi:hypothetical protein AKJ38_02250 [candidate division MSBL1 archaeon SCGC-AAA259I14]|uniref:Uncharacterized protein n=1 Tax=candidate division MSBL1 archaeon SCGC-AAA259I14 TaxID=1698268 RepID=A0A133US45_9EURY|nr:hypothetical protein AKJ38_02250 [candidate division MSBL1 archaeon SCGC-AAA259I14]
MGQVASDSKWTKERVIRKLRRKKEELGKSPSKRDVSSSLAHAATKLFGSWNRAKEEAGLETFEASCRSKEKIVNRLKELAEDLGRFPAVSDDSGLAQVAQYHFGSWNAAKRKAGPEVFEGRKEVSPPETEKVDESPEIDEDMRQGLLTSVKRNADVYEHHLSGEKVKRTLGDVAEDLLVSWAKRHKEEVVGDFIYDEDRCRVSYGVPDEHNRCNPRYGIDLEDIRCDLLFLIDQPSTGRSFVMFEAKYGQSGINHEQAQYFRKAHHSPDKIVEDATEGHVMLAKCFNLDIRGDNPRMRFYMGELIVPDEDPLEEG